MLKGLLKRMTDTPSGTRALPELPEHPTRGQVIALLREQGEVIAEQKTAGRELAIRVKKAHSFCQEGVDRFLAAGEMPRYGVTAEKRIVKPLPEVDESLYTQKGLTIQFRERAAKYQRELEAMRRVAIRGHQDGYVTEDELAEFCGIFHLPPVRKRTQVEAGVTFNYIHDGEWTADEKARLKTAFKEALERVLEAENAEVGSPVTVSLYTNEVLA